MSISVRNGQKIEDIADYLQCPANGLGLQRDKDGAFWSETTSGERKQYPVVGRQPVLIDFDRSILSRDEFASSRGDSLIGARVQGRSPLKKLLLGENGVAASMAQRVLERAKELTKEPVILIIGGGTVNVGARELYEAEGVRIISFDIYASANTDFVADAHDIPLRDGCVHAVWIQAVLEHVLTPSDVVDEIWRVLAPDGIVYAETPFLQPVHETAFDFTRFTESGHRWLFKRFEAIDSGVVMGPGTVLFQALRYAFGAALRNRRLGSLVAAPFFWVRFLDLLADRHHSSDSASGVYFLGRRSEVPLRPSDMPAFFKGVR